MLELINECNTEIKDLSIGPNLEEYCRKQLIMITFSTKNLIIKYKAKYLRYDKDLIIIVKSFGKVFISP